MERKPIAVLFFLVSLMALASCSKFTNGEPVTEQRSVDGHFCAISMYNNVNVNLVHNRHPRLELTCPKNLIEKVTTEVIGDTLYIKNENDFNWLRSYDYSIDLTVYYDSLYEISFASNGQLFCDDSIKGMCERFIDTVEGIIDTNYIRHLYLNFNEGSGDVDLTLGCEVLKNHLNNGTSKVTLRGTTSYAEHISRSYGVIHAEELKSFLVNVQSRSTNDIYVWAQNELKANLYSIGNLYYKGNPRLEQNCFGDGCVIKVE